MSKSKQPIVKKTLLKVDAIDFQDTKCGAQDTVPIALVLELEIKEESVEEFIQVKRADACDSCVDAKFLRFSDGVASSASGAGDVGSASSRNGTAGGAASASS